MSDACEDNTCGPCLGKIASALERNDSGKEEEGTAVRVVGSGWVLKGKMRVGGWGRGGKQWAFPDKL